MAHFQDGGDTEWKPDGTYLNKPGKRLEGLAIRLVGDGASKYELTYTAHVATKGDRSPFTKDELGHSTLGETYEDAFS